MTFVWVKAGLGSTASLGLEQAVQQPDALVGWLLGLQLEGMLAQMSVVPLLRLEEGKP